jgi:hypothetical protein
LGRCPLALAKNIDKCEIFAHISIKKTAINATMGGTKMRVIAKTLSIAAAAALFATPVAAQKTINLTAIDGYPPKASWVREFIGYYIPEVNKQLAAKGN